MSEIWADNKNLPFGDMLRWIESEIEYEEHKGVHTYHQCKHCEKRKTRAGKCARCLKKERDLAIENAAEMIKENIDDFQKKSWSEIVKGKRHGEENEEESEEVDSEKAPRENKGSKT